MGFRDKSNREKTPSLNNKYPYKTKCGVYSHRIQPDSAQKARRHHPFPWRGIQPKSRFQPRDGLAVIPDLTRATSIAIATSIAMAIAGSYGPFIAFASAGLAWIPLDPAAQLPLSLCKIARGHRRSLGAQDLLNNP